jgi:Zn-dependent protease
MFFLSLSTPEKIAFAITALLALAYHEFAHAIVADRLGDPTPRSYGRISLNPIVHLDLMGVIFLFLAGFGWATTPVNPNRLRGNPRTSMAIVAVAGPLANLAMAIFYALPIRLGLVTVSYSNEIVPTLYQLLIQGVWINLLLFVFNLLPFPPLDGFTILLGLLPAELAYRLEPLRRYGSMILIALIFIPTLMFGVNILFTIINPITQTLLSLLTGLT